MHGNRLFATCISVWKDNSGWRAIVTFEDFGHCDRGSVMGSIETKYADTLQFSIDTIKCDVEALGIEFHEMPDMTPALVYRGDGEHDLYIPPDGWRELLRMEAERIGFVCPHAIRQNNDTSR